MRFSFWHGGKMEFLIISIAAVILSGLVVTGLMIAFINTGVFPPPQEDDLLRKLYWRKPEVVAVATDVVVLRRSETVARHSWSFTGLFARPTVTASDTKTRILKAA
jgi:hypothetical protein